MALIYENVTCPISKKKITTEDSIIAFPPFECTPDEPFFICYEAVVLREEFEKWEFRNEVQRRFAELVKSSFLTSKYFVVAFVSEEFLIAGSLVEENIRVFFLQEILELFIPKNVWANFCNNVILKKGSIVLFENHSTFRFEHVAPNSTVKIWVEYTYENSFGKYSITMPEEKWIRFVSIIQENKNTFTAKAGYR